VALFNYLFARSRGGRFLLRIEDTDRERSTPEAVEILLGALDWLELSPDEEPLYQSTRAEAHLQAADRLIESGHAYRHARSADEQPAVYFHFPEDASFYGDHLREAGPVEKTLTPGENLRIEPAGIRYVGVSRKGKPDPGSCCRAGMHDLEVKDAEGKPLFRMGDQEVFETDQAVCLYYTRRELVFQDLVKGEIAKPLDSVKDRVIVRGDGSPVFHLANVCDDAEQRVSHIIRGDDHVENTFLHLPMFLALEQPVPAYGHLPMITNDQGKPYSKRDGDAFVGDFRAHGILPEALFNYLVLLGWSPGDDREKMNRDELIAAFSLDRVQSSPARMDLRKLSFLNSQYLQDLPETIYLADVRDLLSRQPWAEQGSVDFWTQVARLMRPKIQTYGDVLDWSWWVLPDFERAPGALKRGLGKAWQREALADIAENLEGGQELEAARQQAADARELDAGKLNLPLRVALTGQAGGPDLAEVLALLPADQFAERIRLTLSTCKGES
jgi:glutamyl-tRNA synthetase